jgi:IS5 family transposase
MPEDVRAAAIARLQSAWDPASDPLAEDLELLRLVARLDREDPPIDRLARVANAWRSREALAQARLGVATVEAWRMLRAAGVEDARIAFIP